MPFQVSLNQLNSFDLNYPDMSLTPWLYVQDLHHQLPAHSADLRRVSDLVSLLAYELCTLLPVCC